MILTSMLTAVTAALGVQAASQDEPERPNQAVFRLIEGALSQHSDSDSSGRPDVLTPRTQYQIAALNVRAHMQINSTSCQSISAIRTDADHVSISCRDGHRYTYPYHGNPRPGAGDRFNGELQFYGNMWNVVYETGQGGRLIETRRACFGRSFDVTNIQTDPACEQIWEERRREFIRAMERAQDNQRLTRFTAVKPGPDSPFIIIDYSIQ